MSAWWEGKNWRTSYYGLEDLELIGDGIFVVGVPEDSDREFKRRVFAAGKSYTARYASVDYVLKRYGEHWKFDSEEDPDLLAIADAMREVKKHVTDGLSYAMTIPDKPDRPSLFACSAALFRLQNTFRASVITVKLGLHFESAGLARMILEQLAWVYVIHRIKHEEHNFFEIRPSKCIKDLRRLLPVAGPLYGELSKVSHLEPKETLRYIRLKDSRPRIALERLELSKLDAFQLLVLADMFVVLAEYIYSDLVTKLRFWKKDAKGKLVLDERRPFAKKLEAFKQKLLPPGWQSVIW